MPEDKTTNDDVKNDDVNDDAVSDDDTTTDDQQKDDGLVKSLKTESIKNKKRAQKAEKELEKIRQDKLSDDEKKDLKITKLEKEKEDADKKLKETNVDSMIISQASKLGFQDIDVVKLIAQKELADEEDVTEADVKAVIDSIAKEKPYLLGGNETTDIGKGNFAGGNKVVEEPSVDEMFAQELKDKANF